MRSEEKLHIALLLTDSDPDVRRNAAEALGGLPSRASLTALAAALRDEHKGVRDAAARSLLALDSENAARAIIEYLEDDALVTRNLVSDLLVQLGEKAITPLLPYLQHNHKDVRKFAIDILGLIRVNVPVNRVLPLLRDPDMNVIISTVEALGNIGSREAVEPLLDLFERCPEARPSIVEALGKIGDVRTAGFLLEQFQRTLQNEPENVLLLYVVLEALAALGDRTTVDAILPLIETFRGKLFCVALHACVVIAERTGAALHLSDRLQESLLAALEETDTRLRISAARALAQFPAEEVTSVLLHALGKDEQSDEVLIELLKGRVDAFHLATELLERGDIAPSRSFVRLQKLLAEGMIRNYSSVASYSLQLDTVHRATEAVIRAWQPADQETREYIITTLFRLNSDRAIDFVGAVGKDPDPWIRLQMLEIMKQVNDPRVPEYAEEFLADEHPMVREAAEALIRVKGLSLSGSNDPLLESGPSR